MDWSEVASVDLPQGTQTEDMLSVADQLEAQAKAAISDDRPDGLPVIKRLDETVEEALEALLDSRDILRKMEAQRVAAVTVSDDDNEAANNNADDAWRAIERFLEGKSYLPDRGTPGRKDASRLHALLFRGERDGLKFVNTRPRRQWDVARELIAEIEKPDNKKVIQELGGERELKALLRTHREFGLAFGFLKAQDVGPEAVTDTRAQQLALQAALRNYLLKVTARVTKRDPKTAMLARYLLKPYVEMVEDLAKSSRRKTPSRSTADAPPPAGKPADVVNTPGPG